MTDLRHTPPPWTMETVRTSCGICHRIGPFPRNHPSPRFEKTHACVYVDHPSNGPAEAELLANARLIAAAPDLLSELENMVAICAKAAPEHDLAIARARAAIAKATTP